jgi:hypothetical protein
MKSGTRLPARDGKTPSNYVEKSNGEIWYQPLPATKPNGNQSTASQQKTQTAVTVCEGEKKTS